jgi:cytochrome c oxidase subunit 3
VLTRAQGLKRNIKVSLGATVIFGLLFLVLQGFEYRKSFFALNSFTYGACFFLLTGFHGAHVTIGVLFLSVCLFRLNRVFWFKKRDLVGFECAR